MEFSWTTFALEGVNFLVLVAILHWLLYRPVLAGIASRQAKIQDMVEAARDERKAAAALKDEYGQRLVTWETEKASAQASLDAELAAERTRRLAALQAALDQERIAAQALDAQRQSQAERQARVRAYQQAVAFCTRLLRRLSGPELHKRIVDVLLEDLKGLPDVQRAAIGKSCAPGSSVLVSSAVELEPEERSCLELALNELSSASLHYRYAVDTNLLSGLKIEIGAFVLDANLATGLQFFIRTMEDAS